LPGRDYHRLLVAEETGRKAGARPIKDRTDYTRLHEKRLQDLARIIHECRCETGKTEARRGFSQVRVTQAYSLQYVEETEREKPRRARVSTVVVGIHE
jgi:hypothetical protein